MTVCMTGPKYGKLVGMLPDVREVVRNQKTTFTPVPKRTELRRQETDLPASRVDKLLVVWQWLSRVATQQWLLIEGIDLAWGTVHRQKDDAVRLRCVVLLLARRMPRRTVLSGTPCVATEQVDQRKPGDSVESVSQKISPIEMACHRAAQAFHRPE